MKTLFLLFVLSAPVFGARFFIARDGASVIREKQVFTGDESKADDLVAAFLATRPGWTAQEVSRTVFDGSDVVFDHTATRADAVTELLNDNSGNAKVIRAVFLVALDEVNLLRQRDVDRAVDVAASTSLADLKTRWAARNALADRTAAQFRNAVQAKINAGSAD